MLTPQGNTTDVYSVIDKQVKRRMDEMLKKEFGHELFSPFLCFSLIKIWQQRKDR